MAPVFDLDGHRSQIEIKSDDHTLDIRWHHPRDHLVAENKIIIRNMVSTF